MKKTSDSHITVLAILAGILILGAATYFYFGSHAAQSVPASPSATSTSVSPDALPTTAPDSPSTSSLQTAKYTDTTFGFSFWYPQQWSVDMPTIDNTYVERTYASGARIVKILNVHDPKNPSMGATIVEVSSPHMSIYGDPLDDASPLSSYENYYFDPALHTWMVATDRTPTGKGQGTTTADVSNNTMGGLHIFPGYVRFGQMDIVPLSATHFLAITDNYSEASDGIGPKDPDQAFSSFVHTIVATDPSVATPLSEELQEAYVSTEAVEYGGRAMSIVNSEAPHTTEFSHIAPSAGDERIDFGDGKMQYADSLGSFSGTVSHTYTSGGFYTVTLYRSLPSIPIEVHHIFVR